MIRRTALTLFAALVAGPAFAQTNVAVVDFEAVIARSQKARTALGEVGLYRQSKKDELDAKTEAFRQKQNQAQAQAGSMSDSERREVSNELQRMKTDLDRAAEDADREVQQRANQVLNDLNKELGPLVRQLAMDRGIDLVLQYGAEVGIVFVAEALDITNDVIAAYDATE